MYTAIKSMVVLISEIFNATLMQRLLRKSTIYDSNYSYFLLNNFRFETMHSREYCFQIVKYNFSFEICQQIIDKLF